MKIILFIFLLSTILTAQPLKVTEVTGKVSSKRGLKKQKQILNKLLFIRDFCPKLENRISVSFDNKSLTECIAVIEEKLGASILSNELPAVAIKSLKVKNVKAVDVLKLLAQSSGTQITYSKSNVIFSLSE
jgi:hypothetical protein